MASDSDPTPTGNLPVAPVRKRKPGPKDAPEVTRKRVEELIRTLESTGWTKRIEGDFAEQWQISCRQVRWLKQKAVKQIAVSLTPADREKEAAQHLSRTRAVFDLAMAMKDAKGAIAVLRHEARILGLEKPQQIEVTTSNRNKTDEELAREEAALAAALGEASS